MEEKFRKYIILWLSQSISGLGSSITGFALVLWAYGQSHSAMSVSLMSFCNYVPYVIISLFVGDFIDRHKKKTIMLVSDNGNLWRGCHARESVRSKERHPVQYDTGWHYPRRLSCSSPFHGMTGMPVFCGESPLLPTNARNLDK